jgi:hypothetical protein
LDLYLSVATDRILLLKKGRNKMNECKVCFAQRMSMNSISVKPDELCDNHYRDWADEKTMGEWF